MQTQIMYNNVIGLNIRASTLIHSLKLEVRQTCDGFLVMKLSIFCKIVIACSCCQLDFNVFDTIFKAYVIIYYKLIYYFPPELLTHAHLQWMGLALVSSCDLIKKLVSKLGLQPMIIFHHLLICWLLRLVIICLFFKRQILIYEKLKFQMSP